MAKRNREEAADASDVADITPKKIKKEEKEKKSKSTDENGNTLSKEERKALRRAKKLEAQAADTEADVVTGELGTADADELAAKAERKARKKAEKAAKRAAESAPNGADAPKVIAASVTTPSTGAATTVSAKEADDFYKAKQIVVEDPAKDDVRPVLSFDNLSLDQAIKTAYFSGFSAPTPIQAATWPYLMKGRDLIGVAETGSGKTYAFGLPCIDRLSAKSKHIQVCIVSPTRELALQIQEQMVKLGTPRGFKATCVYGGVNKDEQRNQLKGTSILVATPGRLNDFIGDGSIDLSHAKYLVLDEADRMLDTGFEQDVRKIISSAADGPERQTVMFTATWPPSVRALASEFLRQPVRITIGDNQDGELRANIRIKQEVEVIDEFAKQGRLLELLKQYQSGKNKSDRILVFCLYKKEATRIEEFIRRNRFPVSGIHGDLSQQKRMESLEAFKTGQVPLLVATDVAARGLDIPAVKLVINVTFPLTVEDYVHRIGRTGRAGQPGHAITLFTQNEKGLAGALMNVLKGAGQPIPDELMKFGSTVKKKGHDAYGAFYKDVDPSTMKKATKITFD
jgi:ATP-dependent RNA helicase DBP3